MLFPGPKGLSNDFATHPYDSVCNARSASCLIACLQDNLLHGSFLAELTKEVLTDLEASKYQHAEYRISIYGRKRVEWDILAAWIVQNQLYSDNVVWLIQVGPCILCSSLVSRTTHHACCAHGHMALPRRLHRACKPWINSMTC